MRGASFVKVTGPAAPFAITGIGFIPPPPFAEPVDGHHIWIWNSTAQNMTMKNENVGSAAAARIHTLTGADVVLVGESLAEVIYVPSISRWLLIGTTP